MTHEMDTVNDSPSIIKEDMGPWMLINYRNKKKVSKVGGSGQTPVKGSRFSVLQDENVNAIDGAETIVDNTDTAPPIVKLWTSFQEKKKKVQNSTISKAASITSDVSKASQLMTSSSEKSNFGPIKAIPRVPLNDLSNVNIVTSSKNTAKCHRKTKGNSSNTDLQSTASKKLSFENVDGVLSTGYLGIFGHCPPEENMIESKGPIIVSKNLSGFVDQIFADNSTVTEFNLEMPGIVDLLLVLLTMKLEKLLVSLEIGGSKHFRFGGMQDWVYRNGLVDLCYQGADYTWTNNSVKERLDMSFRDGD
ncbi:hypothetical protein ACLB2K_056321 [Fragaria x ananassa]